MVRVADYIAQFLEKRGIKHVFTVTGGGAMFLNDGLAKKGKRIGDLSMLCPRLWFE